MHRFLLLLLPFAAAAQDKGMQFEHGLPWAAIQAKAKAQNKYIFVDCYTTWCGPCRFMATTVFPTAEAGGFFNDRFLNVAVQLDTTARDNAETRGWYADAHALMAGYRINAFPTYLIFSPDGRPVHRLLGSTPVVKEFIAEVGQSFDTTKQYYTGIQQFHDGRRDSGFLRRLALQANDLYDLNEGIPISEAYYATQPGLYTPGALKVLIAYTYSTTDKGFPILLDHAARVDSVMGAFTAERYVNSVLVQQFIYPLFHAAGAPDWKKVQASIAASYPAQAEEVTLRGKVLWYEEKQDWTHYKPTVIDYLNRYGSHVSPEGLNDYANTLYKLGKKDEAIAWEQKAIDLAAADAKPKLQATLEKIRKGEKTGD